MSHTVKLHLLHRRRRIVHREVLTRNVTVTFLHLRMETHAAAELDVAFFNCSHRPMAGSSFAGTVTFVGRRPTGRGYSAQRDKIFTDTRIHRAPDCAVTRIEDIH